MSCVLKLIVVYNLGVGICQGQRYFIVVFILGPPTCPLSLHSGLSTFNLCFSCWYVNSNAAYIKLFALSHFETYNVIIVRTFNTTGSRCGVNEKGKLRLTCQRPSVSGLLLIAVGLHGSALLLGLWQTLQSEKAAAAELWMITILLLKRCVILKMFLSKIVSEEAGLWTRCTQIPECVSLFILAYFCLEISLLYRFFFPSFYLFPDPWMQCSSSSAAHNRFNRR